jgi:galactose mutarotase-like enzyme
MPVLRLLVISIVCLRLGAEDIALAGGGSVAVARLESGGIAVAMVPQLGGKLISLRGPDGYEWLSRSAKPYRSREGLATYGDAEFDGADEIFPTMDPGDGLPAHGEVWRQAWTQIDGPGLSYAVDGQQRPYRFARTITIADDAVELNYAVDNRSDADLHYVYLFHPLFSIAEPLRMELPDGQAVRITNSQHHFLGQTGSQLPWSTLVEGPFAAATAAMSGKRFWSLAISPAPAFVRLRRPNGATLTLTWTQEALPHLAVWCSEASPFVADLAHLAPEPCTGLTKRLSDAIADGTAATIPARGQRRWTLRLAFSR